MLRALEQIRRMRGGAQSHLMRCDDGNYYVVKFQNNPQHRRVLVNELLGTNALQLSPQTGTLAQDLDAELERLYGDHVALQRAPSRVGAPGSRAQMRSYCQQVFRHAGLWERIGKRVPVSQFTIAGDPLRIDYSYRRNGTRGFVHTLPVRRAPGETKNLAYTAEHISAKAPWKSEFAAVTDVDLSDGIPLHRFVRDTLRDAGIEPVPLDHFAVWAAKLKPMIQ